VPEFALRCPFTGCGWSERTPATLTDDEFWARADAAVTHGSEVHGIALPVADYLGSADLQGQTDA